MYHDVSSIYPPALKKLVPKIRTFFRGLGRRCTLRSRSPRSLRPATKQPGILVDLCTRYVQTWLYPLWTICIYIYISSNPHQNHNICYITYIIIIAIMIMIIIMSLWIMYYVHISYVYNIHLLLCLRTKHRIFPYG